MHTHAALLKTQGTPPVLLGKRRAEQLGFQLHHSHKPGLGILRERCEEGRKKNKKKREKKKVGK